MSLLYGKCAIRSQLKQTESINNPCFIFHNVPNFMNAQTRQITWPCSAVSAYSAVCQASYSQCDKSPAGSLVKNTDVV